MSDSLADPLITKRRQIEFMLSQCEIWPQKLDEWEQDFISEIRDRFDETGRLSDGQAERLRKIYVKVPW